MSESPRNQAAFIQSLANTYPSATFFGSIGTISYDLKDIPLEKKFLVKGAMGHVLAIALGYALGKPDEQVIALIGDGSFLMKMGSISTILATKPQNLTVYVLNNDKYASCGCQGTNFQAIRHMVPFEVIDVTQD